MQGGASAGCWLMRAAASYVGVCGDLVESHGELVGFAGVVVVVLLLLLRLSPLPVVHVLPLLRCELASEDILHLDPARCRRRRRLPSSSRRASRAWRARTGSTGRRVGERKGWWDRQGVEGGGEGVHSHTATAADADKVTDTRDRQGRGTEQRIRASQNREREEDAD